MSLLSTQRCVYSGQSLPSNIPAYAKWLLVWKAGFLDQACRAKAAQFKSGTKELLFISRLGQGLLAGTSTPCSWSRWSAFTKPSLFPWNQLTPILQNGTLAIKKKKYMAGPDCCTIWKFCTVCKRFGVRTWVSCWLLALLHLSVSKAKPSAPARSPRHQNPASPDWGHHSDEGVLCRQTL